MKNKRLLRIFVVLSMLDFASGLSAMDKPKQDIFAIKRQEMIEYLVSCQNIKDKKVLAAMGKVERHKFVPEGVKDRAYEDTDSLVGYEKFEPISPIHEVAIMTQGLELEGDERVLEVGTGTGYQAAVLAEIAKEVYSVEIIEDRAKSAEVRLKALGYSNIKVKQGDGFLGWAGYAPYDAIMVTAAVDKIPNPLIQQLAEGGRMIIPLNLSNKRQEFRLIRKINGKITQKVLNTKCSGPYFSPMMGEHTNIPVTSEK